MFKKSQAALEFLTTYAWAFLVIIIMVGALAYFGILSPSKLFPDRCNFGSEIICNKDLLVVTSSATNTLNIKLRNNFAAPVVVTNVEVKTDVAAITSPCTPVKINDVTIPATGTTWPSDTTITLTADCSGGANLVKKEKIKFNLEVSYYPVAAGSTYGKIIFGETYSTIQ